MGSLPKFKKWHKEPYSPDHDGHIPTFATISDGKTHDSKFLATPELPKGAFVIVDRAYSAPKWFLQMCQKELFLRPA